MCLHLWIDGDDQDTVNMCANIKDVASKVSNQITPCYINFQIQELLESTELQILEERVQVNSLKWSAWLEGQAGEFRETNEGCSVEQKSPETNSEASTRGIQFSRNKNCDHNYC